MKKLISLAVVVAFFIAVPQCLGQSQDADQSQPLTEQQLVQMFHMVMVQRPDMKICHVTPAGDPLEGIILLVNDKTLDLHLSHGDCEDGDYIANPDERGDPCRCPCVPPICTGG